MKYFLSRIAIALLLTSLASVTALARVKKEKVTFPTNIKVNGTLVKRGVYDLKFDDKAGELTIVKDGKVIARANASVEKRQKQARQLITRSIGEGDDIQLTRVTFSGADHDVVISGSQASR